MTSAPAEPTPLSARRGRSSSLSTALAPLSISPNSSLLLSSEFKNAFHQRSASTSSAIPIETASSLSSSAGSPFSPTLPLPLSNSPTSTASSTESERLTTPSSSPTFVYPLGGIARAKSLKECAIDEVDSDDDGTETIFAGGARWGWPQQSASSSTSTAPAHNMQRRASLGPAPLTSPLGRVQSASGGYAAPSAASKSSENGIGSWGIFRRLSQSSNFAGRPKPPIDDILSTTSHQSPVTTTTESFPPMAPNGASAERGRKASAGAPTKAKRKLSPMGERMLTGLHH